MITWIQKYFQHHFRTIFAAILVAMSIGLIASINASAGFGGGTDRRTAQQKFLDLDISNRDDPNLQRMADAEASIFLQTGRPASSEAMLQSYEFSRYAALYLAAQFHLPPPSQDELAAYIKTLVLFQDTNHVYNEGLYNKFRDDTLVNPQFTTQAFARVLSDDVLSYNLRRALAGPGFPLPSDVRATLAREDTMWKIDVATLDYASFNPAINPTEADLIKSFAEHPIEIPAQIQVDAIDFPAADEIAKVTVKDQDLRDYYKANPDLFPKPKNPPALLAPTKPAADTADADFAAVRTQVEAAYRFDRARRLAETAASNFVTALDEDKIAPDKLAAYLTAHARTARAIPPFPQESAPAELGGNPKTTGYKIFKELDAAHPYSDALPNEKGAAILIWRGQIPSRKPQFAEVKDKVEAAYRVSEKKRLFIALGDRVKAKLASNLKAGEDFAKALSDATSGEGSLKADSKSYPSLTLRQHNLDVAAGKQSDVLLDRAILEFNSLGNGQVSEMITLTDDNRLPEKGLLIHAADKKLPDLTLANPEYEATQKELAIELAAITGDYTLNEFVSASMPKADPAVTP